MVPLVARPRKYLYTLPPYKSFMATLTISSTEMSQIPMATRKTASVLITAAPGDQTIVPAVTGKRIAVLGAYLTSSLAANAIQVYSGPSASGSQIQGLTALFTNLGQNYRYGRNIPIWVTEPGEALVIKNSISGGTAPIGGMLQYVEL